jgi:YbgC/YbaW family acyl-CoA thioester hydrolase
MFRMKRIVEFGDTDMAGIVHFAQFFNYMEAAEHAFLRSLGFSVVMEWEGVRIGVPRVAASCEYLRPVRFEDELEITVSVKKLGRSSITYRFQFFKDGAEIAHGEITAVFCRMEHGEGMKAMEIPAAIRGKLERGQP